MKKLKYDSYCCTHCNKETKKTRQKINLFCSHQCQKDNEYLKKIEEWKNGLWDGNKSSGTSNFVKRFIEEKFNHSCVWCGIKEWRGERIVLTVDHIDGDAYNSSENNLTLLCPNCHSQTSTYAGRNKGKGTRIYRKKYDKKYALLAHQAEQ